MGTRPLGEPIGVRRHRDAPLATRCFHSLFLFLFVFLAREPRARYLYEALVARKTSPRPCLFTRDNKLYTILSLCVFNSRLKVEQKRPHSQIGHSVDRKVFVRAYRKKKTIDHDLLKVSTLSTAATRFFPNKHWRFHRYTKIVRKKEAKSFRQSEKSRRRGCKSFELKPAISIILVLSRIGNTAAFHEIRNKLTLFTRESLFFIFPFLTFFSTLFFRYPNALSRTRRASWHLWGFLRTFDSAEICTEYELLCPLRFRRKIRLSRNFSRK